MGWRTARSASAWIRHWTVENVILQPMRFKLQPIISQFRISWYSFCLSPFSIHSLTTTSVESDLCSLTIQSIDQLFLIMSVLAVGAANSSKLRRLRRGLHVFGHVPTISVSGLLIASVASMSVELPIMCNFAVSPFPVCLSACVPVVSFGATPWLQ
jgi:FtsH-binding integral membrane protein